MCLQDNLADCADSGGLPEDLKKLSDGSQFLIYAGPTSNGEETQDPGHDDPIMLTFLAEHGTERLRVSNLWLCDGTFNTAPKPSLQIYIIFAQTGSGKVLPAAFCLFPQKEPAHIQEDVAEDL